MSKSIPHQVSQSLESSPQFSLEAVDKVESLWKDAAETLQASFLLRGIGYGLLLLAVLDLVTLFIPSNFMNPAWELQTYGTVVERVAVPLVALAFLFWGGRTGRFKFERPLLGGLSWLSLAAGVLLWLMIPLAIFNAIRVDRQNNQQVAAQVESTQTQVQQIQTQLNNIQTPAELEALIQQFNQAGSVPRIESLQQLETVKQELASNLTEGSSNVNTQAQALRQNQRLGLIKSSVKWNLGALVAGTLFVWIWFLTDWSRGRKKGMR